MSAQFSCEQVIQISNAQGVVLGKKNKSDVAEERDRFAYKDIETVKDQTDLVVPVKSG